METYHRKRSKRTTINANELMSLKGKETSSVLGGAQNHTPPLARQLMLDTNYEVSDEEVELGSVYEIYHKNLPPRTPVQLRSTRVVMVSEKTELNVSIRYPSVLSLRTYFSSGITEMYPALDEKFGMGIKLARKVLLRQVPSQEFGQKKHLEDFWMVNPNPDQFKVKLALKNENIGLAKELKNNMVRWGVRRQVMFIGGNKDKQEEEEDDDEKVEDEAADDGQEENDDHKAEEEEEEEEEEIHDEDHKRKLRSSRKLRKGKKVKQNNQLWQVTRKPMKKCKKLARDPTNRWSKERYMAAELSLLEAMKGKKAMIGNPITRPALRVEARKKIGDTGLLDHLLKHVANKVAPGGSLRFRRSHNADGAMEYWLEYADLLKIRKEAGVSDPFWTPPPSWKPGDSPIQDPIMAKELNYLKEKISSIEREKKKSDEEMIALIRREFVSKKEFDEETTKLRRDVEELISKSKKDQSQVTDLMVSEHVDMKTTSSKQVIEFFNSLLPSESEATDAAEDYSEKSKKKMLVFSDFLKKKIKAWMQEEEGGSEVGKETSSQMEAIRPMKKKTGTELITATVSLSHAQEKESEKAKVADQNEAVALPKQPQPAGDEETFEKSDLKLQAAESQQPLLLPSPTVEGKAARIERLKSGFRICRPQGTFLWPNMMNSTTNTTTMSSSSSQLTTTSTTQKLDQQIQVEDLLMVPTPPSVNSFTHPFPPYHHLHFNLPSPVKPFPERRPITLTADNLLNLNDIPTTTTTTITTIMPTTTKLLASGANFPGGFKKRKTSSSSSSSTSPSCLSNIGTPGWLVEPHRHQQRL